MKTVTELIVDTLADSLDAGLISDEDFAQFSVYLEAFALYQERNARYQNLWKREGAQDSAHHCKHKALRIFQDIMLNSDAPFNPDDALDLVNYSVFTIRNVRAGRVSTQE